MKVQLIVVQGKPEGKVIPLAVPRFKIGRGEGCHLRPNNEQISRQHSEILVEENRVLVRDLGSRNGTFVNNSKLGTDDHVLKNGDLIQVGSLTFAVSIQGAPTAAATQGKPAGAKAASLDELSHDSIDAWLVGDESKPVPERPSGVYSGDTQTFNAYQEASKPKSSGEHAAAPAEPEPTPEPPPVNEEEIYDKLEDEDENAGYTDEEEFVDESNPFYTAKKQTKSEEAKPERQSFDADTSSAAEKLLRQMMDRKRGGQ